MNTGGIPIQKERETTLEPQARPGTPNPLSVLLVEDNPVDGELAKRALENFGFDLRMLRVEEEKAFREALDSTWDIVISDYALPRFSGLQALHLVRERGLDLPFILFSGTVGEETAVQVMKAGAQDFLLKSNLSRLGPAVARELDEAALRRHHQATREALRNSEARFGSLVDSMEDIVCLVDRSLRLKEVYGRGRWRWSVVAQEHLGRPLAECLDSHQAELVMGMLHQAFLGRPKACEYLDQVSGSIRCYRLNAAPIADSRGEVLGIVLVAHDFTDFMDLQEKVARQERLAALGTLVGGVAHEVRNPLGAIQISLEMLQESIPLDAKARGFLAKGQLAAERIFGLMNDLLDYANPRPIQLKSTPLSEVAKTAIESCRPLAQGSEVSILEDFQDGGCIRQAEPSAFFGIVRNLVENALQHSPKGSQVRVVTRMEEDDQTWRLTVEDEGPGIPVADLPRLFDPFFTRRHGGTGLGLAISQRAAEAHGGRILGANGLERGALFTLWLPLSKRASE